MSSIPVLLCLLQAWWTEGADINVEGIEGQEASFRCSHKLAWGHSKYLCKGLCKNEADVLLTVDAGQRAQKGQISLIDSGNGVFTVTFGRLQLSDAGTYWCGVARPMWDTFTLVRLRVTAAPTTTATPDLSTTSILQTLLMFEMTTTPNHTAAGSSRPDNRTAVPGGVGAVLHWYAIAAGIGATLGAMALVVVLGRCRKNRRVCCPRTHPGGETEADCDYDDIRVELPSLKNLSHPRPRPTQPPKENPCGVYENLRCSRYTPASAHRAPAEPGGALPPRPRPRQHGGEPSAPAKVRGPPRNTCKGRGSQQGDSVGPRPASLWFGLDVSGTR